LICKPSYSVWRKRCAQWNSDSTIRASSTSATSGLASSVAMWSRVGGVSHPSGKATPKRNSSAGISIAETTPPALKSIHRNGSASRLIIYAPRTSQNTTADATSHAA
jgi:hypothetical protein